MPSERELMALAERVEQATGPDRELDLQIHIAVGNGDEMLKIIESGRRGLDGEEGRAWELRAASLLYEVRNSKGVCWANGGLPLPAYTASLDAAMSLVPEDADAAGERFRLEHWHTNGVHAPHVRASAWVAGAPRVYAATPALALTAAALRAHASLQDSDR